MLFGHIIQQIVIIIIIIMNEGTESNNLENIL